VLLTEFILTFLLMTAKYGTAVDERGRAVKIGGFGIGLIVAFDILAGGSVAALVYEHLLLEKTAANRR
jgi:glycerol uptake facilitator-like aquaporin